MSIDFPPLYSWDSDTGQLIPGVLVQQWGAVAAKGLTPGTVVKESNLRPPGFGGISLRNRSDPISRLPFAVS